MTTYPPITAAHLALEVRHLAVLGDVDVCAAGVGAVNAAQRAQHHLDQSEVSIQMARHPLSQSETSIVITYLGLRVLLIDITILHQTINNVTPPLLNVHICKKRHF